MSNKIIFSILVIPLLLIPFGIVFVDAQEKDIALKINGQTEKISFNEMSSWIEVDPILKHDSNYNSEIENPLYCPFSYFFCDFVLKHSLKESVRSVSKISTKEDEIRAFLEDLGRKVNKDPVDAKFKAEGDSVTAFALSQKGFKLKIEESAKIIQKELLKNGLSSQEITLVYESVEPEIKSDDIDKLGINSLIGEGTSNFRGSTKSRIHNINVATGRFDGHLIKPGEEFSFVDILGEVDGEHGYLPELVIKKDKTEPEFGGGVCQVSTTAFRAAIYSGLEITARRNHAYPVQYYSPQGMDATVYIPRPDLRFKNNTSGHILIQTNIEETVLTFQFYGTDEKRKITVEGPFVTERNPDGSMKTYFTQKVLDKDDNVLIDDIFRSSYDSPNNYPHPGEEQKLTEKPKDWSKSEWKKYKKENGL